MTEFDSISPTTYRRFILGCQGLWPGRRFAGREGTARALHLAEAMQVDPVAVVAQSPDIALWGRVADYRPAYLQELLYGERRFFDYGDEIMIYPVEEFPYWLVRMKRHAASPRWAGYIRDNQPLLERVRSELRARGPLGTRDLQGEHVNRYRSTKDTGIAMYCLWIAGELTIHSRRGRDRVYDFTDKLIPAQYRQPASEEEADDFFIRKAIAQYGFVTEREFARIRKTATGQPLDAPAIQARLARMLESGQLAGALREDTGEALYYPAERRDLLAEVAAGRVPPAWQPLGTTTAEEATLLSPLEFVSARGRARTVFGFDYTWEIYKPIALRKYGPYTLPVLYGDRLAARVDLRLERLTHTLHVNGFWPEEGFQTDKAFSSAFARGLENFAMFLEANHIDMSKTETTIFNSEVKQYLESKN